MPLFVRLIASDKGKIMRRALSQDVLRVLDEKMPVTVSADAVEILLNHLLQHDDLWYEDALALHPGAHQAFFALKIAFKVEKLVSYSIPEAALEEEHIINALKKHGYWPWY